MSPSDTTQQTVIFHIDVNNAYLSWSALKLLDEGKDVDLRDVPSIVGGDRETRHGIVVAKSTPAKALGIRTADTVASALRKCPSLVMVPPDHEYYSSQGKKLIEYLSSICPRIERMSIDECFMDFEPIRGSFGSPEEAAVFIRDSVHEKFHYTVNVGVSDRKVLAKMASDLKKPNRMNTLYASEIREKMWPLPIGRLFMCGRSSAAMLEKMGIHTIGDLANTDKTLVESWLKSHGRLLWEYANGIDSSAVEPETPPAKGIGHSITLSEDVTESAEAHRILRQMSASVAERLKKHGFLAGGVSTEIKYASFRSVSHQTTLEEASDSADEIGSRACALFDELWDGEPIRLLGVRTMKLREIDEPEQIDLFSFQREQEISSRQKKLDDAMARIRERYGDEAVRKGWKED